MGKLHYGDSHFSIDIDDRALAHLQLVIFTKLRRGESFAYTWDQGAEKGFGRGAIWIHSSLTLRFEFLGSRYPDINRRWLEELAGLASSSRGLYLTREPTDYPAGYSPSDG